MEDKSVAEMIKSVLMTNEQISTFTWVNHYSCLVNISNNVSISDFNFVGIDGQFLAYLMEKKVITSAADRVLPIVLQDSVKVLFIGGTPLNTNKRLFKIKKVFPKIEVVGNYDGFTVDTMTPQFAMSVFEKSPNLIIIGTGSPSQEKLSTYLKKFGMDLKISGTAIVTCGGWLDQILLDSYYPSWSYQFKINWIIRLIREPMRLWKRYSVYAIEAIFKKPIIRKYLDGVVS